MSVRTIVEINHDHLHMLDDPDTLLGIVEELKGSNIPAALNKGIPVNLTPAIRVLGQRHHSEPGWVQDKPRKMRRA